MRTTARSTTTLAAGVAALLALSGCSSAAATDDTLVLASIPIEESTSLQSQFGVIVDVIEKVTGKTVDYQPVTDYASIIEGQRAGKVDIAYYGPFGYMKASDSGVGAIPLAVGVNTADAEPAYYSVAVTKPDSGIKSLADVKGKTVCFVDPGSTSGYLYPIAGLMEVGIDPETDITPIYAGGHDASALGVKTGQCDVGFATDIMVRTTLPAKGQISDGDIAEVWQSEAIVPSPFVISGDLPEELTAQLTDIFQNQLTKPSLVAAGYCADEASCELPEATGYGYVPVTDADFEGVRKVCEITQAEACK
jgi:phosphonate transport system substrate-binding protein